VEHHCINAFRFHVTLEIISSGGSVMHLGLISKPTEESFAKARAMNLDFLEFCINRDDNVEAFLSGIEKLRQWSGWYGIAIGSVGRWKAETLRQDGAPDEEEMRIAHALIDAAAHLGSPVYVCGCNRVPGLSYFDNCSAAILLLDKLLEHGRGRGVKIATYNCRKGTFIHDEVAWKLIHGHLKDLGIKYDPSHSIYAGADYLKETSEWGSRFCHVHLKGSLMLDGKRVDDPPAGMDQTDWPAFLSILRARGYDGGLSIEPHSDAWTGERLDEGIGFTIRYMDNLISRRFVLSAAAAANRRPLPELQYMNASSAGIRLSEGTH
jgi:sugar phosphate isomerase/epimerase